MNKISWIIFFVITIGILILLVVFSGSSKIDVSHVDGNSVQQASDQNGNIADHTSGNIDGKVVLIEYADFQCPGCASIYPVIKSVTDKYSKQMLFIFRNYPLTELHPNAKAASGSAEAAGLQGKYWEMHDKIYGTQSDWSTLSITDRSKFFENLAKGAGVDVTKFNSDLLLPSINAKISFDSALGNKAGVNETPTFFLNGKKLEPSAFGTEAKLIETINAELVKAGIALPE